MSEVRRISQSEMKTFLRCKRKWWLSDFRRLAPKGNDPTGPLKSGSRVHTALEAFYTPGGDALQALVVAQAEDWQAYVNAVAELGAEVVPDITDQFAKDCELERIMVEGYGEWIAESGADAGLEVISTEEIVSVWGSAFSERTVEANGDADFQVVGKLDMRLRRQMDGARLFLDHKTAKSLTDAIPTLRQDPQMLHYHWLEAQSSDNGWCDGALYNVLKKVKRSKTAKPPFYARYEVHHNADEIENYELRMSMVIEAIFRLENRLAATPKAAHAQVAYPTPTRDCAWDCPFVTVCPMFDDGSRVEHALADNFQERDPLARYSDSRSQGL
jgi:hypothetical protein